MDEAKLEAVRRAVNAVAPGMLASYGDIARAAGLSSPRHVARALRLLEGTVPWHRVVRADGRLPEGLAIEQGELLIAEGHHVVAGRVLT